MLLSSAAPKDSVLVCPLHGSGPEGTVPWACRNCGATLRPMPDLTRINLHDTLGERPYSIYRFRELLPVLGDPTVGVHTGWTPLVAAPRLAKELGLGPLYLKLDCYNWPSYSYKDRVVALGLQRAVQDGNRAVACVSTGNVGNAVAAHAAAAGLRAIIFYPAGLEPAKNVVSLVHGASVIELDGTFDEVNAICRRLSLEDDIPFVNLTLRPYYADGAKSIAYEVVEQLGWLQPDHVIVPTAGAALLTRMAYGFEEMSALAMSASGRTPRIHAAQAAGCAPIAKAFAEDKAVPEACTPDTLAKSLAIGNPSDGTVALQVIRQSGGTAHGVSDEEIVQGIELLAATEGVFTEPAGGAAIATAKRLASSGHTTRDHVVVIVISGSGLKTQEINYGMLDKITRLPVDYEHARRVLQERVLL
jgi:threonine synthase